ncbi:MAG: hypothetical protein IKF38_07255 [Clostridia bacterium]|nr:hypothetical protein [Clostridia bacterium]
MENASKALMLAGGVLISLIIISMIVLVSNSLTSYQYIKNQSKEVDLVADFNAQYEAYNRDDVRGNDLYTLANKVIDYNRRQTASIADPTDVGDTVGYKPITLTIDFGNATNRKLLTIDNTNRIFQGDRYYAANGNRNDLEYAFSTINGANGIETRWGSNVINELASHITEIYLDQGLLLNVYDLEDRAKMVEAIQKFDRIYGNDILKYEGTNATISKSWRTLWTRTDLKDGTRLISSNVKEDVYTYFEFVNFKRARFNCTSVVKDETSTGRITSLSFKFTGEIN